MALPSAPSTIDAEARTPSEGRTLHPSSDSQASMVRGWARHSPRHAKHTIRTGNVLDCTIRGISGSGRGQVRTRGSASAEAGAIVIAFMAARCGLPGSAAGITGMPDGSLPVEHFRPTSAPGLVYHI